MLRQPPVWPYGCMAGTPAPFSAAMRLMRVTHLDTQHILFELNHDIEAFCDIAEIGDIEQMSSYVPIVDVLAAVHVKAHVRLFMN